MESDEEMMEKRDRKNARSLRLADPGRANSKRLVSEALRIFKADKRATGIGPKGLVGSLDSQSGHLIGQLFAHFARMRLAFSGVDGDAGGTEESRRLFWKAFSNALYMDWVRCRFAEIARMPEAELAKRLGPDHAAALERERNEESTLREMELLLQMRRAPRAKTDSVRKTQHSRARRTQ